MTTLNCKSSSPESVEKIKSSIASLLKLESKQDPKLKASDVWEDVKKYFLFLFDLSYDQLKFLRLHTSLFSGVPWFNYIHSPNRILNTSEIEKCHPIKSYISLISSLPKKYWLSEPILCDDIENVGLPYKNRIISDDVVRFQRCITNCYNFGIFETLNANEKKPIILEIGGGYGHLAHQFNLRFNKNCTYIIVDLPSSLLWSSLYLHMHNPDAEIYIHCPDDTVDDYTNALKTSNFLFIPNTKLELIDLIPKIDFAVNLLSFQEMTNEQINSYCSLLSRKLDGFLYSENFPKHWINKELDTFVENILQEYFDLTPKPEQYLKIIPNPSNPSNPKDLWTLFSYFCKPHNYKGNISHMHNVLITQIGEYYLKGSDSNFKC